MSTLRAGTALVAVGAALVVAVAVAVVEPGLPEHVVAVQTGPGGSSPGLGSALAALVFITLGPWMLGGGLVLFAIGGCMVVSHAAAQRRARR